MAGINPSLIRSTPGKGAAPVTQILVCSQTELAKEGHKPDPLVIGDTFTIASKIFRAMPRINVYADQAPAPPAHLKGFGGSTKDSDRLVG